MGHELVSVAARGTEAAADWGNLESPENYVGYERTENLASPGGAVLDQRHLYAAPKRLPFGQKLPKFSFHSVISCCGETVGRSGAE